MAHIRLPEGIPGILGPMAFSPETANPSTLWPKCYSAGRTVCLLRTVK
jgi:hypothetical protein